MSKYPTAKSHFLHLIKFPIFSNLKKRTSFKVKERLTYVLVISFLHQSTFNNRLHYFDNPDFVQQLYNRFLKDKGILLIFQINLIFFLNDPRYLTFKPSKILVINVLNRC